MTDELTLLKKQADILGVQYSNNIGVEKLKERIKEAKEPKEMESKSDLEVTTDSNDPVKLTKAEKRRKAQQEQTKLIRVRVSNMNPAKREVPGGIHTVANKHIGRVRKYIPYIGMESGYHIPQCLYEHLKNKVFTERMEINDRTVPGGKRSVTRTMREFSIEVLPPLTPAELKDLAKEQAAGNRV